MAIFASRIGLKPLAAFCRRFATSLSAGLDILGTVEREATSHAPRDLRHQMALIHHDVRISGLSFAEAVANTGSFFPPVFRELVAVGEETGQLPETLRRLADNFEYRIRMRRTLLAGSFWPLLQGAAALFIISMIILVQGFLPKDANGNEVDLLQLGLSGMDGFLIYWAVVGVAVFLLFLLGRAVMRGAFWTRPLQKILLRIPVLGTFLEAVAMGNLAWSLSLTMNTSLDLRRSIPLSLNATNNAQYKEVIPEIVEGATSGLSLYESFSDTHAFPGEFLDVLQVGEESGQLPEAMHNFSERCRETAETLLHRLAIIGGVMVAMLIGGLILLVIFRMLSATLFPYFETINELSKPGAR